MRGEIGTNSAMKEFQLETLARCIEDTLSPLSFKRFDPVPEVGGAGMLVAWKRKTLSMNRGVAILRFGDSETNPGEFAQRMKKSVGKAIGYLPFFYELGLQLILVGRDFIHRASDLPQFVDKINTQTIILQSIHLVEMSVTAGIGDPQAAGIEVAGTPDLPGFASGLETVIRIKNPFFRFDPGKVNAHYSPKTGRASMSVSTWGQSLTRPIIDALETGIKNFLEHDGTT
jgi:hypothetical protein